MPIFAQNINNQLFDTPEGFSFNSIPPNHSIPFPAPPRRSRRGGMEEVLSLFSDFAI
jgi:hypothetical protein